MQSQFVPLESALFGALEHIDVATKKHTRTLLIKFVNGSIHWNCKI